MQTDGGRDLEPVGQVHGVRNSVALDTGNLTRVPTVIEVHRDVILRDVPPTGVVRHGEALAGPDGDDSTHVSVSRRVRGKGYPLLKREAGDRLVEGHEGDTRPAYRPLSNGSYELEGGHALGTGHLPAVNLGHAGVTVEVAALVRTGRAVHVQSDGHRFPAPGHGSKLVACHYVYERGRTG